MENDNGQNIDKKEVRKLFVNNNSKCSNVFNKMTITVIIIANDKTTASNGKAKTTTTETTMQKQRKDNRKNL